MDIIKCRICRKPFHAQHDLKVCNECLAHTDEDFVKIREHLEENPHLTSVAEIAEGSGVSAKMILYLLEEGRLTVAGMQYGELNCQVCGRSILSGKLCEKCAQTLSKEFNVAEPQAEAPSYQQGKMHVNHNRHPRRR